MRGVESIDGGSFDPSSWGYIEAVLAGPVPDRFQLLDGTARPGGRGGGGRFRAGSSSGANLFRDLDVRGECSLDFVGIGGSKIDPIVSALVGEGDLVSQSGVDRFSVEIVDELANKYLSHSNPLQ